ncbi:Vacuolar membrane protease [Neolecta irregularis DAH-3]|uniref:Peptide hydrolase n=1 Tax=Neolecta irregularis (strain DAH-3) TaxID=1198029 RepID=A0A1U7LJS9_NEOID|nr:Vacuolar membrane protease [Neolecta irregularis DAH-3]|eukprot:OLL22781.1 Vacuolar membrane protease [Neolecta irregularis DAH-3]
MTSRLQTLLPPHLLLLLATGLSLFLALYVRAEPITPLAPAYEEAWDNLLQLTALPHPYSSHANDRVYALLESQLSNLAARHSNICLKPQNISILLNATNTLLYFESTNLILRIPGTSSPNDAILVSAHFDSVSTARGATDNGMGTVAALELARHFASHPLKKTLIFNFNNAEEDNLLGAYAFLQHPWAYDVTAFLNLEGAGSGGKALLFRASSDSVAKHFSSPQPAVTILGNDFFNRGVVHSQTDYVVYETLAPGLDIAFFQPRALYHTRQDDVAHSGRKSLQHMITTALQTTESLGNGGKIYWDGKPMFFDFLNAGFAHFKLAWLQLFNFALLLLFPWIIGLSFFIRSRLLSKILFRGLGRAAASVCGAILGSSLSLLVVYHLNPYVLYSKPYLVVVLSLLCGYLPMHILARSSPSNADFERVMTLELMSISWLLLFISSIVSVVQSIGFLYINTISFVGLFIASLVALFESSEYVQQYDENDTNERTPFLPNNRDEMPEQSQTSLSKGNYLARWTWIVRFLVSVPISTLLILQNLVYVIIPALHQTASDGNPISALYISISVFTILSLLPLPPFLATISLTRIVHLVVFITAGVFAVTCMAAPFTDYAPLKFYYMQEGARVSISGLEGYIQQALIFIPSARLGYECTSSSRGSAIVSCEYKFEDIHRNMSISTNYSQPPNLHISIDSTSRICDVFFHKFVTPVKIGSLAHNDPIERVRMYRRSWDKPHKLSVRGDLDAFNVTCLWDEDVAGLLEVQNNLPSWATVSKGQTGLFAQTQVVTV